MPFGEVERIRELYNLTQEVRPRPEALDNSGHLLPSGTRTPKIVRGSCLSGSFAIFGYPDLGFCVLLCPVVLFLSHDSPLVSKATKVSLTFVRSAFQELAGVLFLIHLPDSH
jgi:hypothetical protein